nr:hypothetical protein [Tanacetum cinerariifolium]
GGAVLKLVTRVKRLEGLLQQRKRRLVLFDSEGEDTTPTEQDINLEALHTLACTSLGGDSSDTPTGKAPMVDDSFPADLLSKQERVLKNLHDSQIGEELAKKINAEQEAEFAKQQEELAQKAHTGHVACPTEHGTGMSDQRRRELDAAQLIYTEADWLELCTIKVPAAPSFPADVLVHAATSSAPTDISVPAVSSAHAAASVPAETW